MTYKNTLSALLAGFLMIAAGSALAQGPMSVDFSKLQASCQKALAAGDNAAAQTAAAEEALAEGKNQIEQVTSPSMQRVVSKLKAAVAASKAGNTADAADKIKEAMAEMKQPPPPKFR